MSYRIYCEFYAMRGINGDSAPALMRKRGNIVS